MAEERTYLELSEDEGVSHKFWECIIDGKTVKYRYGRIGTDGQLKEKSFASPDAARKEAEKKIKSKRKKGYDDAVQGVRKKRAITRRAIQSKKSKAKASPVLWKFKSGAAAFGVFVDGDNCWVGNEDGRIFQVDHDGKTQNQYKLPDGVKCIVADGAWIYAGCDNGKVYDLNGKQPTVAYEIAEEVDIYWLDINDGVLGVSDGDGSVTTFNHEDETQWTKKSKGSSGWMVRCDEIGVYHGTSGGVTMYDWEDGSEIWHKKTGGSVLFGWQEESVVFAGTGDNKVEAFFKDGKKGKVYDCDGSVYSCAAAEDGKYVFAGDSSSSVYCFNADGERLWKLATGCGSAYSMQFFNDRLYIVTTEGALACIDASEEAIKQAQEGVVPKLKEIKAPKASGAVEAGGAGAVETTASAGDGVIVECYKQGSKLRVRVISDGYNSKWKVQFPKDIREDGAKFVVEEIRESARGGFYRAYGEIKRLEE